MTSLTDTKVKAQDRRDWTEPTLYLQRFSEAMTLLCNGNQPSDELLQAWLDDESEALQDFAATYGPAWAQGIGLIDAARLMADQPTEGPEHEHYGRPATSVYIDFAHLGTAGPFTVVDGRVTLPEVTMKDLSHMLKPLSPAEASDGQKTSAASPHELKTCACGEATFGNKCSLCYADEGLFQAPAKAPAPAQVWVWPERPYPIQGF